MDWTTISWFALAGAAITLLVDWFVQIFISLRWGPPKTRDLVIAAFKDKKTANDVREALDLPTRAEVSALSDKVRSLGASLDVHVTGLAASMTADVRAAVASIPKPDFTALTASIIMGIPKPDFDAMAARTVDEISRKIGPAVEAAVAGSAANAAKSMLSQEARKKNKEIEQIQAEYMASAMREQDSKVIYNTMRQMGVPEGMAQMAAQFGPSGAEWAMEQVYGKARTAALMDKMAEARIAAMPMAGKLLVR